MVGVAVIRDRRHQVASLQVTDDSFSVYLIPETLRVTVLGSKCEGDTVNIEIDAQTQAIVNTVERVVEQVMAAKGLQSVHAGCCPLGGFEAIRALVTGRACIYFIWLKKKTGRLKCMHMYTFQVQVYFEMHGC
eukprot:TRINITY_DN30830_c0_g1_i1.p2 TRINITY_DN30830_c0_g1~~TRINITY_DN30830_c0_g1_i1.p2  ORF type:complete len:146 (-),score=6.59 TRINITY_DN30830_c0_g1_i1:55-453(-)